MAFAGRHFRVHACVEAPRAHCSFFSPGVKDHQASLTRPFGSVGWVAQPQRLAFSTARLLSSQRLIEYDVSASQSHRSWLLSFLLPRTASSVIWIASKNFGDKGGPPDGAVSARGKRSPLMMATS